MIQKVWYLIDFSKLGRLDVYPRLFQLWMRYMIPKGELVGSLQGHDNKINKSEAVMMDMVY